MRTRQFREFAAHVVSTPEGRARVDEYKRVIDDARKLAALRAERGVSQRAIAAELGVSQANISRIEHEEDIYLSTLRRYVTALGGELEISAIFPDQRITLVATQES
jgi:DNA-binding XRE family transcriptional regulator